MKDVEEACRFALKVSFGITAVIIVLSFCLAYALCPWILL